MNGDDQRHWTGEIVLGIRNQKTDLACLGMKRETMVNQLQEVIDILSNPRNTIYQPDHIPSIPTVDVICDVLNKTKQTKESIDHLKAKLAMIVPP